MIYLLILIYKGLDTLYLDGLITKNIVREITIIIQEYLYTHKKKRYKYHNYKL